MCHKLVQFSLFPFVLHVPLTMDMMIHDHGHLGAPAPRTVVTSVPPPGSTGSTGHSVPFVLSRSRSQFRLYSSTSPHNMLAPNLATFLHMQISQALPACDKPRAVQYSPISGDTSPAPCRLTGNKIVAHPADQLPAYTDRSFITVRSSGGDPCQECDSKRMRKSHDKWQVATTQPESIRSKTAEYKFTRSLLDTLDVFGVFACVCSTACRWHQ